ncbi:hypothetical protein [Aquimarina longa]|uniref:hypothetical protein n=1 Tax=Aquimarina longa TaxID=1080221 RepID=UPI0007860B32|nr:hypothetical protein [Aquimarina longa]
MTSTYIIEKLINPDFRCVINQNFRSSIYNGFSFRLDSEYYHLISLGGIKECIETIIKKVENDPRYILPVAVQVFDQKTGKLVWHGTITKQLDKS